MYWLKRLWKRLLCSHSNTHYTETECFHVTTCQDCGHQHLERKIR